MELDSHGLGRSQRVSDPREVWPPGASDFTPWLVVSLDVLADELGVVSNGVATEVPGGSFYLDIRSATDDGETVIVENESARINTLTSSTSKVTLQGLRRLS